MIVLQKVVPFQNPIHKNLYVLPFLLTIFGPVNYGPP